MGTMVVAGSVKFEGRGVNDGGVKVDVQLNSPVVFRRAIAGIQAPPLPRFIGPEFSRAVHIPLAASSFELSVVSGGAGAVAPACCG